MSHKRATALRPGDDSIMVVRSLKGYNKCVKTLYSARRLKKRATALSPALLSALSGSSRLPWMCEVFICLPKH